MSCWKTVWRKTSTLRQHLPEHGRFLVRYIALYELDADLRRSTRIDCRNSDIEKVRRRKRTSAQRHCRYSRHSGRIEAQADDYKPGYPLLSSLILVAIILSFVSGMFIRVAPRYRACVIIKIRTRTCFACLSCHRRRCSANLKLLYFLSDFFQWCFDLIPPRLCSSTRSPSRNSVYFSHLDTLPSHFTTQLFIVKLNPRYKLGCL